MNLLQTERLTMTFGGLTAVDRINFHISRGETVGIIGPNGSGKTTFFNLLSGIYEPTGGRIIFEGRVINGARPDINFRLGIARTFQNGRLFLGLNVLENVMLGLHAQQKSFLWGALTRHRRMVEEERQAIKKAREIMGFFSRELLDQQDKLARNLSYADRRRLEICRAVVSRPKLLLLDEPSAGMNPSETEKLVEDIRRIHQLSPDIALVIIEHDMSVIEGLAQRVVCFNYGQKIAEGTFAEVSSNPEVIRAYLGEEEEDVGA